MNRLDQQLSFVLEIDKLRPFCADVAHRFFSPRKTPPSTPGIWQIMSLLLAEYATEPIDVPRVTKMLLLHDLIENRRRGHLCL